MVPEVYPLEFSIVGIDDIILDIGAAAVTYLYIFSVYNFGKVGFREIFIYKFQVSFLYPKQFPYGLLYIFCSTLKGLQNELLNNYNWNKAIAMIRKKSLPLENIHIS